MDRLYPKIEKTFIWPPFHTMARPSLKRSNSESTTSTLSCITVANNNHIASATPPTEYTDSASMSSNKLDGSERSSIENRRVKRVRMSTSTSFPAQARNALGRRSLNLPQAAALSIKATNAERGHEAPRDLEAGGGIAIKQHDGGKQNPEGLKRSQLLHLDGLETNDTQVVKISIKTGKVGRRTVTQDKIKRTDRRKSLRPRFLSEPHIRGSEEQRLFILKKAKEPRPAEALSNPKPLPKPGQRVKRWLSQGLYVGQDPDFDARLSETKNKLRRASRGGQTQSQRTYLPLPMFAGQRNLERGRDFKLSFDIFSPLPPGQPKPEEWRKTQKSSCFLIGYLT